MKILVASLNPVKINATKQAFALVWPTATIEVEGIVVDSGVRDQPMSNEETLQGAKNRSNKAKELSPEADFWVGIEGGLHAVGSALEVGAWMYIQSADTCSHAKTGSFPLPKSIAQLVIDGLELGDATDTYFNKKNTKHASGLVGVLTNDVIDRTHYYVDALVLALIPFMNGS